MHSTVAPVGSSDAISEAVAAGNDSGGAETGGGRLGMGVRDTVGTDSDSVHDVEMATVESALDAVAFHPLVGTMDHGVREEVDVPVGRSPDLPVPEVSSHGTEPLWARGVPVSISNIFSRHSIFCLQGGLGVRNKQWAWPYLLPREVSQCGLGRLVWLIPW